ncbi:MAG: hypothetical protein R2909_18070 [Gemmatimonadales bacterium]
MAARDTTLIRLQGRLADSLGVSLRAALDHAVYLPARATADSVARSLERGVDRATVELGRRIEGDLNRAAGRFVASNFDQLELRTGGLARTAGHELTGAIDRELSMILADAGDSLARRTVVGLANGLRTVLEPVLHEVMQSVTDSLRNRIRQVDTVVAGSRTVGGLRYGAWGVAGLAVVVAALVFWHWRRQRRALDALIDAVNARADPALHQAIRSCGGNAGLGDWLTTQVAARQRTRPIDDPGAGSVG